MIHFTTNDTPAPGSGGYAFVFMYEGKDGCKLAVEMGKDTAEMVVQVLGELLDKASADQQREVTYAASKLLWPWPQELGGEGGGA